VVTLAGPALRPGGMGSASHLPLWLISAHTRVVDALARVEHQGIVYYSWHGQSYSIDASGNGSAKDVSVYLDPADPSQAMIDNIPDRVVAGLLIAGPVVAALVLLVLGGTSQLPVVPPENQTGPRVPGLLT
jgi:hypothetical protein